MKTETKLISPEILLGEYRKLLQDEEMVNDLPLLVSGNSMSPFLIGGRDTIYLSRLTRPVRRGDALLYQRSNGAYVFHRVYRVTSDGFVMVGDAQTVLEYGIQPNQVVAIMTQAERKGKILMPGCFWWDFFEKIWIRIIPMRRLLWRIYGWMKKPFCRKE